MPKTLGTRGIKQGELTKQTELWYRASTDDKPSSGGLAGIRIISLELDMLTGSSIARLEGLVYTTLHIL